jgi:acyl-CoA reductase-like NAD-dependent aldehyde dehydrogenase
MVALAVPVRHPDLLYIDGRWVKPASDATIDVIDSSTEKLYFRVAEAAPADMDRGMEAARRAFDSGPWPRMTHQQRAEYLRSIASALRELAEPVADMWPRESGVLHSISQLSAAREAATFDYYADLANSYPFEELARPTSGGNFGMLVREPVGVVGAIIPWNGPLNLITAKLAPALLAGCTVVIKASPEAPGAAYLIAEVAETVGLPPGVVNIVTADREVSELLVTDPRVDKIAFTGSTAAGRRIASLLGERIGRFTLELGGKSAAVVLDDADIDATATALSFAQCFMTGQVCASLTRVIVSQAQHDQMVDALAARFAAVKVGDPFDSASGMGPLAMKRQLERVEHFIARGIDEGASLVYGGQRPAGLDRGYYIEPTLFANVDNSSTLAQNEIFGPVLSVIAANDEAEAIQLANDTIYGLNASVFTEDADRALSVARQLRSGTVGHNALRVDFGIAFGGFKQSGIGREGGTEGLKAYFETKTVILDDAPTGYP